MYKSLICLLPFSNISHLYATYMPLTTLIEKRQKQKSWISQLYESQAFYSPRLISSKWGLSQHRDTGVTHYTMAWCKHKGSPLCTVITWVIISCWEPVYWSHDQNSNSGNLLYSLEECKISRKYQCLNRQKTMEIWGVGLMTGWLFTFALNC